MAQPRMAGKGLLNSPYLHAAAEALLTSGAIAVPQIMAGEDDLDLALGVLAGLGAAVPGAIIGNKGGRLIGRQIDRHYHDAAHPERMGKIVADSYMGNRPAHTAYSGAMNVMVPGSRHNLTALEGLVTNPNVPEGVRAAAAPLHQVAQDRYVAFNTNKDGSVLDRIRNGMESDLGMLGQKYGDNVAQLIAQMGVAGALQGEKEE